MWVAQSYPCQDLVACITVTVWPPELLRASLVRAEDELRRGVAADLSPPARRNLCDYPWSPTCPAESAGEFKTPVPFFAQMTILASHKRFNPAKSASI